MELLTKKNENIRGREIKWIIKSVNYPIRSIDVWTFLEKPYGTVTAAGIEKIPATVPEGNAANHGRGVAVAVAATASFGHFYAKHVHWIYLIMSTVHP